MHQSLKHAVRVPVSRVALLATTMMALPSFALTAGNTAPSARASVPIGADAAAAGAATRRSANAATRASARGGAAFEPAAWEETTLGGIDSDVFAMALGAARCAVSTGVVRDPATLTVIDYSKPSTDERLWVYDLRERQMLYHELVAHGQGSGANLATAFSNEPDTHRTSIGLFVTDDTYVGRNGYSLRLDGLDRGFNDRARERAIVMHGAPYVSQGFIKAQGRLGRSWGCPALSDAIAREVIDTVKGGSLVFSYYPDQKWLDSSRFLGECN